MRFFTTIFLLCFIFGLGVVFAQTTPSIVADQVATKSPLYYNHTPNIARTSDGDVVAVWKAANGQIVFSEYDSNFQLWSAPVQLSNAGDRAEKAGIAADESGNLYCIWQQRETSGEDYAIYLTKYDGVNWSTPVNLTGNNVENEEGAVEVGDQGNVYVAWNTDSESDGDEFVLCIKSTDSGANWSTPDTLSSLDGVIGGTSGTSGRPFLARATGGKMLCTWHEEPDGHPDRESFINQYDGAQWLGELVHIDVADSANSMYPTIAGDSEDNIYMVYVSFNSPFSLILKKKAWGDAAWGAANDTVYAGNNGITKPYMGIDDNDYIYMVFRNDNLADTTGLEDVAYVVSEDRAVTWTDPVNLNRTNYDAGYVTLAPHIRSTGVDVLWRESASPNVDDGDTTAIVFGSIDLIVNSISGDPLTVVKDFNLDQNYPNPFNPTTQINYSVTKTGTYEIAVMDILGKKVRTLESGKIEAGKHNVIWDSKNDAGFKVASGVYFYQLKGENITLTKKMVLMR